MKPLLPTLKEKKRFVVYEVVSSTPLNRDISSELLDQLHKLLGVFGSAQAGLLSIEYDAATQTGILRMGNAAQTKVRAALVMITHLGRTKVSVRTRTTSGILAKARRFTEE